MKILIINQPLNNRGDEAAHKAFVRTLLQALPEAYFAVLFVNSYSPEGIRQFTVKNNRVVYVNLHPKNLFWKQAEKWIDSGDVSEWGISEEMATMRAFYDAADYVICAPGGICMGAFQDWWHLFYLRFAQYRQKPLIYYGRSFGPFPCETERNQRFKAESLNLLKYFSFISIRDQKTEELAIQLGLQFHSTLDVAFLECPNQAIPQELVDQIGDTPYMVFVPNYLLWHSMYRGKFTKETIIQFYCDLIDIVTQAYPELNIVMLPQTFGSGTYEGDDVLFFRDIAAHKQDQRLIVIDDIYSSDIQQTIIAGCRFLIGARYHSVVFALNQNVPFIALNYEHNIQGLLSSLGKQDCMVDIMTTFDDVSSTRKTLEQVKQHLLVMKKDSDALQNAQQKTQQCINHLVDFLNKQS